MLTYCEIYASQVYGSGAGCWLDPHSELYLNSLLARMQELWPEFSATWKSSVPSWLVDHYERDNWASYDNGGPYDWAAYLSSIPPGSDFTRHEVKGEINKEFVDLALKFSAVESTIWRAA